MNRDQLQLIGLWVIAVVLTVIAITQVIQIYHSFRDQKKAEEAAKHAPANLPIVPTVDPNLPKTTMVFADTTHDFGTINEGDTVVYAYKFTNTGKNPLNIANAFGSCGCTVPYWPKKPIMPGKSEEVRVVFHSAGKEGYQKKIVTLQANTVPEATHLQFRVNVKPTKK